MFSKKLFRRLAKKKPFCDLQTPLPESNTAKVKNKCLGGKTTYSKSEMHTSTTTYICIISMLRVLNTDRNNILLGLKFHWLHDASIRREETEWVTCHTITHCLLHVLGRA